MLLGIIMSTGVSYEFKTKADMHDNTKARTVLFGRKAYSSAGLQMDIAKYQMFLAKYNYLP